jgi:hypothetical protein
VLDEELSRLPDRYRVVVVLCDLEGKTRKEVARQLGVPEGTVAGWLARARVMLAKRLTQRGVTLSGGALAAVLSQNVASAGVPALVVSNMIKVAKLLAAGEAARGAITVGVAALTEGVIKTMLISKLKTVVAVVLVLGLMVAGVTTLASRIAAEQAPAQSDRPATAEERLKTPTKGVKLAPAQEEKLKWGKPVNGLRAAVAIGPPPGKAKPGDMPIIYVVVQNVSKAPLRFTDSAESPERRALHFKCDGRLQGVITTEAPTRTDVLLQPREVAFLLLFPPVPWEGHKASAAIADVALKDKRETLLVHMHIPRAPAGAWTGKLTTGETSGAAATIKKKESKEKPRPLGSKELSGTWRGEKDGVKIEIAFSGQDGARWTINTGKVQFKADLERADWEESLGRQGKGAMLAEDDPVHLLFRSKSKPGATLVGSLDRGDGGTLKLSMLSTVTDIWGFKSFETVQAFPLSRVQTPNDGKDQKKPNK